MYQPLTAQHTPQRLAIVTPAFDVCMSCDENNPPILRNFSLSTAFDRIRSVGVAEVVCVSGTHIRELVLASHVTTQRTRVVHLLLPSSVAAVPARSYCVADPLSAVSLLLFIDSAAHQRFPLHSFADER